MKKYRQCCYCGAKHENAWWCNTCTPIKYKTSDSRWYNLLPIPMKDLGFNDEEPRFDPRYQ
jgi:hypothetical protein